MGHTGRDLAAVLGRDLADMEVDMGEATVEVMAAVMAEVTAAAMVATTGRSAMSNFHPFSHVFNLYTTNLHPS